MTSERRSSKSLVLALLILLVETAAVVVLTTAPLDKLIGPGVHSIRGALHGLFAGIVMITMTIGVFQGARLWSAERLRIEDLEAGSLINAIACLAAFVSGNFLLAPYRSTEGPREYFLANRPEVHRIFFEFKEFAGLLCLPLAVAACYIIWRYGERLQDYRPPREIAGLLLFLSFFYFMSAFALGAAITRLRPV